MILERKLWENIGSSAVIIFNCPLKKALPCPWMPSFSEDVCRKKMGKFPIVSNNFCLSGWMDHLVYQPCCSRGGFDWQTEYRVETMEVKWGRFWTCKLLPSMIAGLSFRYIQNCCALAIWCTQIGTIFIIIIFLKDSATFLDCPSHKAISRKLFVHKAVSLKDKCYIHKYANEWNFWG